MDDKTIALLNDIIQFLELRCESEQADQLLTECRRHIAEYDAVDTEIWLESVRLANVI